MCWTCQRRFRTAWMLVQHVQNEHGVRIYVADESSASVPGSGGSSSKKCHSTPVTPQHTTSGSRSVSPIGRVGGSAGSDAMRNHRHFNCSTPHSMASMASMASIQHPFPLPHPRIPRSSASSVASSVASMASMASAAAAAVSAAAGTPFPLLLSGMSQHPALPAGLDPTRLG